MCSLRDIELFLGRFTHEKSILKALPMNKCIKAELYFSARHHYKIDSFSIYAPFARFIIYEQSRQSSPELDQSSVTFLRAGTFLRNGTGACLFVINGDPESFDGSEGFALLSVSSFSSSPSVSILRLLLIRLFLRGAGSSSVSGSLLGPSSGICSVSISVSC